MTKKIWRVMTSVISNNDPAEHSYVNGTTFVSSIKVEDNGNRWMVFMDVISDSDPTPQVCSYTNGTTYLSSVLIYIDNDEEEVGEGKTFDQLPLYEQCQRIYGAIGQWAVFDFIHQMHPEVLWGWCEACVSDSPVDSDICLVCGSVAHADAGGAPYSVENDPDSMIAEARSS